jgi:DNA-directed RNA polymerase subunit L
MTIIEQESCYQVIQLTKEHPSLSNLFLKLQSQGRNWVDILKMLREALEERSDDLMGASLRWPVQLL